MRDGALHHRTATLVPWLLGAAVGVAVTAPAWRAGSLAMLDLIVGPQIQVPSGVWGLGPELPRRGLFVVPLAIASQVMPGPALVAAAITLAMAAGCAGVHRLTHGAPSAARLGAGLVYACSPYLLTRVGVGHLGLVLTAGLLPWALPTLARPSRNRDATFLWLVASAMCGFSGALIAAALAVGGWLLEPHRARSTLASIAVPQLLWLVPGLVVSTQIPSGVEGSSATFATTAQDPAELASVLVGGGFWIAAEQAGPGQPAMSMAGLVLTTLALLGRRRLPSAWGPAAVLGAGVGLAITLASATPGLRRPFDVLTASTVGAPLREGQRFAVLFVLWSVIAGAHGVAALTSRWPAGRRWLAPVLPILGVALVLSSLWGVGGRLRPAGLEADWESAQHRISTRPGSVVALPFSQYVDLPGSGRRVLHPATQYLDADVIASTDPGLETGSGGESDPRANAVTAALTQLADDARADALARIGVRWLVVVPSLDHSVERGLRADPGLRIVFDSASVLLVENQRWSGRGIAADGSAVSIDHVARPWARASTQGRIRWLRSSAPGWLRGFSAADRAPDGTMHLPASSGPIWFWPTTVVLGTDLAISVLAVRALRHQHRRRPTDNPPNHQRPR